VTKNGSGTLTYNFPNTYTGLTTINAGTLAFGCDNATMSGGITVNGGTLDIGTYSDMQGTITLGTLAGGSGTISGSTGMLSSATWTVYAGTISAKIGGDGGALTKSTPGTVTLSGANEFTGATTVSAGILKLQNSAALGTVDGVTTLTSGASIQIDGNGLSIPEFMTIAGVGLLNQGAIFNTTGDNAVTGLVTLSAAASIETATGTTLTFSDKGFTGAFVVSP
jgi:autotransporter-associated beta strand protein